LKQLEGKTFEDIKVKTKYEDFKDEDKENLKIIFSTDKFTHCE